MNNIEKLKMHSPNLTDKNIAKIAEIFPNCTTEILDENGKPKIAIDFDLLQQELSGSLVGGGVERYQLNWPGKREALLTANAPIAKTLRPVREESVHFDSTENLFIEGDNLDALKLLQETYLGKVKMIYIDPPYNTGKDFVYADDFAENTEDYLRRSNQKDEDGNRMEVNSESNGRFHSDWLSMMYPRLKLARNLLTDDGVIFISIDDNEQANLKRLCDEVFGEGNFIAKSIHKNNSNKNQSKFIGVSTEYVFIYAKNIDYLSQASGEWRIKKEGAKDIALKFKQLKKMGLSLPEIEVEIKEMYKRPKYSHLSRWNKVDEKGVFLDDNLSREGGKKDYTIINPHTNQPCLVPPRGWGKSYEELLRLQEEDLIWYGDGNTPPRIKSYIEEDQLSVPDSFWYFDNSVDTRFIKNAFGSLVFDNPKPLEMIKRTLSLATNPSSNDLILDFFAGSGTTAHAVMQLNAEDGGNRRFICVQLPEDLDEALKTADANAKKTIQNAIEWLDAHNKLHTIAEITKERIRRAADKICSDFADKLPENWDGGFRVLKTDTSNMADVYYTPEETLKKMQQSQQDWLNQVSDNIKPDRTPEDLLFQVMLDWGVDLALPIEVKQIMGRTVFFVDGNTLIACFDKQAVDNDFITALTQYQPLCVVFRDDSFKDDAAKINTSQIFQQYSESTEVKTI